MHSTSCGWCAAACLAIVAHDGGAAAAQSIVPIDQDRGVNSFVIVPQCLGDDADAVQAAAFEPFDEVVQALVDCDSGAGLAIATQQSQVGPDSLTAAGTSSSEAHGPVPEVIHAIGDSLFLVTFEMPRASRFALSGQLSAEASNDPIIVLSGATITLTGPGNETIFAHELIPNPDGSLNLLVLDEGGVLEPGVYTLRAEASTVIDNDVPPSRAAQSSYDLTLDVTTLGDLNGDRVVDIADLLQLLGDWGPCPAPPEPCPSDLDQDGLVNVLDLLILLANWG